ncbi:hypothetical protein EGT74_21435 [Chitinophaga lutea]|uniref:Neutral/alkaline non-lysosomal ceramidase N-terminal domain-containing protein n=1 Tax=Chitinophaga lutea TaxID=2488634 RepID=A0A3N4PLJ4_9BACT|nr:neutral/alkaline non-lysosomal ceramidase N-terminal domain-containing protein [Chitinophaga lutea]RPE09553.1 hypothetical protein EGT74_21435 [Chitinophaga lutea]
MSTLYGLQLHKLKTGILCLLVCFSPFAVWSQTSPEKGWKAGAARIDITPAGNMWMAGFAVRTHASTGKMHALWAKALAIEDAAGKKVLLITSDLLGFPKATSDRIRDAIRTKFGLQRDQVMLNSSHTHSGPVIGEALSDIYLINKDEATRIEQYTASLEAKIITLAGNALADLAPADISVQNGVTRFQVNRRNNNAGLLPWISDLSGPNDYAVPVIKVQDKKGKLKAVAFGYACHPTVLSEYQFSGDYPAFAMMELEKTYPGATALFFQGAGADQNPLPRGSVPLARQYGKELAAAVERVLDEDMRKLSPVITTAYAEVRLPYTTLPDEAKLTQLATKGEDGYPKRWAARMLKKLQNGEARDKDYPYPVEVWQLGDQPIIGLGGELVVEYSIRLKEIFGLHAFVLGYCNDVMSYIPSSRILREGGYEGMTACMVYGLPTAWSPETESLILQEVIKLAKQAQIPLRPIVL